MIRIRGAKIHNLKSINLSLPGNSLVVITGVSGSGKSSLAFDTLHVEGQRRYLSTLSSALREEALNLPPSYVDEIEGLSPTIAVSQFKSLLPSHSTLGTLTRIYDYLRTLFARFGIPHCPETHKPLSPLSEGEIASKILESHLGKTLFFLSPLPSEIDLQELSDLGFLRLIIDGKIERIAELEKAPTPSQKCFIILDRIVISLEERPRLLEAIRDGLTRGKGSFWIQTEDGRQSFFSRFAFSEKSGLYYGKPEPYHLSAQHPKGWCEICHGKGCVECLGSGLAPFGRSIRWEGMTFAELDTLSIDELFKKLSTFKSPLIEKILSQLTFLSRVGLGYLHLRRASRTLSGGELQRARLAGHLGAGLSGVTYILDEPSIGLHPQDESRLIDALLALRDLGNQVIVVEHDAAMMKAADFLVELGPGAGVQGGYLIEASTPEKFLQNKESVTAAYLRGEKKLSRKKLPVDKNTPRLSIEGVSLHDLKNLKASFPMGRLVALTGVSGSGKSTLLLEALFPALCDHLEGKKPTFNLHLDEPIERAFLIDASPIGRTPRSNPATYLKIFDKIRDLFAMLPESRANGFTKGRFSFNVQEGCCLRCHGVGMLAIEACEGEPTWQRCPECLGERFDARTLSVRYKGKNIFDILEMSILEASLFFADHPTIGRPLNLLCEIGLGYLAMGQSATTLSGGEAQRLKMARELISNPKGKSIYLLDEPSTGLHFEDLSRLLSLFSRLVEKGHSVIMIEHEPNLIATADFTIELGPGAGPQGGKVVYEGAPKKVKESHPLTHRAPSNESLFQGELSILPIEKQNYEYLFFNLLPEAIWRYAETLDPHLRRLITLKERPANPPEEKLFPPVVISHPWNKYSRLSTVGTLTGIADRLAILFAREGVPHCPISGEVVEEWSLDNLVDRILSKEGEKLEILAPIIPKKEQSLKAFCAELEARGFFQIKVDGKATPLEEFDGEKTSKESRFELVIDKIKVSSSIKSRLREALEMALTFSPSQILLQSEKGLESLYLGFVAKSSGLSYPRLTADLFSFLDAKGKCPACQGRGEIEGFDLHDLFSEESTLSDILWGILKEKPSKEWARFFEKSLGLKLNARLGSEGLTKVIEGDKNFRGLANLLSLLSRFGAKSSYRELSFFAQKRRCAACDGSRLGPFSRAVTWNGFTFPELARMPIDKLLTLPLQKEPKLIELARLSLSYLSFETPLPRLSGSELLRLELARELADGLSGLLYIIDKPAAGLTPDEIPSVALALQTLKERGNKLLVFENHPLFSNENSPTIPLKAHCLKAQDHHEREKLLESARAALPEGYKVVQINPYHLKVSDRADLATYAGVATLIRSFYAERPKAKAAGLSPACFSFNHLKGMCRACMGKGVQTLKLELLPPVSSPCEACQGFRLAPLPLLVTWHGLHIGEFFSLSAKKALELLPAKPKIRRFLQGIIDLGLGELSLSTPLPSMTPGEIYRLSLLEVVVDQKKKLIVLEEISRGQTLDDLKKIEGFLSQREAGGDKLLIFDTSPFLRINL